MAKLDKLERTAQQVVEDIFKADNAPPGDPGSVPQTEKLVPEGGFDAGDVAILIADLAGIVDPTPISDGISGTISLFEWDVQRPKDKPNSPSPLVDRLSGDGKHVNVGTNGRITHG